MSLIDEIVARAKANKQRIVLPEGTEERTLKAKAKVTGNDFGGGVNSQGVLSVQLNIEVMKDEDGKRMKIFAPGIDPETGKPSEEP